MASIFRAGTRSSPAGRAASAGRSRWRWPSAARRSRSISAPAPRTPTPSSSDTLSRRAGDRPRADVSVAAEARASSSASGAKIGPIDILVNNAGVAIGDAGEDSFNHTLATNLKSAYLCTEALLPGMRARQLGTDRQRLLGRGARRGRHRRRLQRLEGRPRGIDAGLCSAGRATTASPSTPSRPGPTDTEMGAPLKAGGASAHSGRPDGRGEDVGQATIMVDRQRLHDRTDDRGERRAGVSLARCGRVAQAERAARKSERSRPSAGEGFHIS